MRNSKAFVRKVETNAFHTEHTIYIPKKPVLLNRFMEKISKSPTRIMIKETKNYYRIDNPYWIEKCIEIVKYINNEK